MGMLAEHTDHVIGVDTHRDAHSAAAVATGTGTVAVQTTIAADAFGYKRLLRFARRHACARRRLGDRVVGQLRRRPDHVPAR